MVTIRLKLSRDEARFIEQEFLPYMIQVSRMNVRHTRESEERYMTYKLFLSLINDVHIIFQRKLLSSGNKISFALTEAHAICFYQFMLNQPINAYVVYANLLRQKVITELHKQITSPAKDYA